MYILGVSCFKQDSAACLLRNGKIIAAVEEERFTRKKFDVSFPQNSLRYCLKEADISLNEIDYVAFYNDSPAHGTRLKRSLKQLGYRKTVVSFRLQEAYLAAAFYPSPFTEAAVLVNGDEGAGIVLGKASGNKIKLLKSYAYSLSKAYSNVTAHLGFRPGIDDYKVMGLAAYGKPSSHKIPPRRPTQEITRQHMDIAALVQQETEEKILKITRTLYKLTGFRNLCLSGSLALNCVANTKILEQGLFKHLWIQPAAGEAGCCVGAAFLIWHRLLNRKKTKAPRLSGSAGAPPPAGLDAMNHGFLGPAYTDTHIERFLVKQKAKYQKYPYQDIPKITAELILQDKVVGWFQGRAEFGPRALGARSILADARSFGMHDRINLEVKFREPFRPLAPSVLAEFSDEYFTLPQDNPYMLLVGRVKEEKEYQIPAVVHVDGSSRVQTIRRETNPLYYDTIREFYRRTNCPAIINTSFNRKNEPIVLAPEDAYAAFKATAMDSLVMGRFVLTK